MRVSFVVAAAQNDVIGSDNRLPWRLPDDLKRFKTLTLGKPILMGRKTFESIGKPLPGRTNIVLSRRSDLTLPGCTVVNSLEAALSAAGEVEELAVIGGAEVYAQAMPFVDVVHLTRVHATVEGDAVLPRLEPSEWRERLIERHAKDDRHAYEFSFIELERIR